MGKTSSGLRILALLTPIKEISSNTATAGIVGPPFSWSASFIFSALIIIYGGLLFRLIFRMFGACGILSSNPTIESFT